MLFHLIGNGSAQHPALTNGIGSLIDQKFRIVFQRGVVNGIWIEGLGIPDVYKRQILSREHGQLIAKLFAQDTANGGILNSFSVPTRKVRFLGSVSCW